MHHNRKHFIDEVNRVKQCNKCFKIKPFSDFSKDSCSKVGVQSKCKVCNKKYRIKNNEKIKLYLKDYYDSNKEHLINKSLERSHKKRKSNPLYRFKLNFFNRIRMSMNRRDINRNSESIKKGRDERMVLMTGLGVNDLWLYIESQFESWMSWDNYGDWHLDHIIPLYLAKNEDEVKELCFHKNLRPLCAKKNMKKNRFVTQDDFDLSGLDLDIKNKYILRVRKSTMV